MDFTLRNFWNLGRSRFREVVEMVYDLERG